MVKGNISGWTVGTLDLAQRCHLSYPTKPVVDGGTGSVTASGKYIYQQGQMAFRRVLVFKAVVLEVTKTTKIFSNLPSWQP